ILKHLFDPQRGAAESNEVGSEFSVAWPAEWHIVPQNLDLLPIFNNSCQGVMGRRWLHGVIQLDIRKFFAPDDAFLLLGGKGVPALHIVQIFLDNDVAAANERRVFLTDERRFECGLAPRILRSVDESNDITIVEVAETVHLIDNSNGILDSLHDV